MMRPQKLRILILFLLITIIHITIQQAIWAPVPPMGWNSYDSYLGSGTQEQYMPNFAYLVANLSQFGYEYAVLDAGWYGYPFYTDGYSRVIPDPTTWPSSANNTGFTYLSNLAHSKGVKFGVHVMRGISMYAVQNNEKILGTNYTAQDIAVESDKCVWWNAWYGVNMSHPAAQAYYDSVIQLYADWELDFIKVDCIFGSRDFHKEDIIAISQAIQKTGREILLSLSPGVTTNSALAQEISSYVNAYRITDDFWDCYNTNTTQSPCPYDGINFVNHFPILLNLTVQIGAKGLNGYSWPDGDMLPLGYISNPDSGKAYPWKFTNLSPDEQYSVFTLWCIFRNPLFFGGEMSNMDSFTYNLITNSEVIEIQKNSSNNRQLWFNNNIYAWGANAGSSTNVVYVALFNLNSQSTEVNVMFNTVGIKSKTCDIRDLWTHQDLGTFTTNITTSINSHGTKAFKFTCQ